MLGRYSIFSAKYKDTRSADEKAKDPKYGDFSAWLGDWDVYAIRVANYDPLRAQEILMKCSKVWLVKAFMSKMIYSG